MTFAEILNIVSIVGFSIAAGYALKSFRLTKQATNVWLLFAIGFMMFSLKNALIFLFGVNGGVTYLDELARDIELVGVALVFAALAIYEKEKQIFKNYCYKKGTNANNMKDFKRFSDGV